MTETKSFAEQKADLTNKIESLTATREGLSEQYVAVAARLATVNERRREHVTGAYTGDKTAKQALDEISRQESGDRREAADLMLAIDKTDADLATARADLAKVDREELQAQLAAVLRERETLAEAGGTQLHDFIRTLDRMTELGERAKRLATEIDPNYFHIDPPLSEGNFGERVAINAAVLGGAKYFPPITHLPFNGSSAAKALPMTFVEGERRAHAPYAAIARKA